jgi:hypothetical protein
MPIILIVSPARLRFGVHFWLKYQVMPACHDLAAEQLSGYYIMLSFVTGHKLAYLAREL